MKRSARCGEPDRACNPVVFHWILHQDSKGLTVDQEAQSEPTRWIRVRPVTDYRAVG